MSYKLGSLFDGSGGFPLAGALCGIEPIWASEVEPYPIAVTKSRFPNMKHLGDISKINGAEIEPVDIITFGSPCQDLSVAGKRAGLKHEANGDEETTRSGLFMEAVRIIKEMRKATDGRYPTFAIWENVPGAFSSNKGEDFKVVLEELIKIVEPTAVMPEVPPKGWAYADCYIGDGWSIAYRVLDAQYWGVPQRRRRIYLVADFRGECAKDILFEREGLRGYFTQGRTPWKTTPSYAEGSSRADDREGEAAYTLKIRSGCEGGGKGALIQKDKSATLATNNDQYLFQSIGTTGIIDNVGGQAEYAKVTDVNGTLRAGCQGLVGYVFENHSQDTRYKGPLERAQTVSATYGMGGNNQPFVVEPTPFCKSRRAQTADDATTWKHGKVANTLNTFDLGEARANELVIQNFIDVEMEVAVRKYEVNIEKLVKVLRNHKGAMSNKEIAEALDCPTTQVEHWFRADKYFAVPEPDIWFKLKDLLGITSTEFDESIMTFEYKGGNYDMRNRIHVGDTSPTLTCGSGTNLHLLPIYVADQGGGKSSANVTEDKVPTLCARDYKGVGNQYVDEGKVVVEQTPHYIVRRLTPTECARLQGFADRWGDINTYSNFTDEEYAFWLEVRNTHARINGKAEKDYTKTQMLTWYNKLQTDSAEYKMWGNGIALPTALYVLQGVTDALSWTEFME